MFGTRGSNPAPPQRERRHLRQRTGNPTAASHHAAAPRRQVARPSPWIRAGLPRARDRAGRPPRHRRRSFVGSPEVRRAEAREPRRRLTGHAPLIDSQIEKKLELRGVLDQRRRVQRGPREGPGALRRSSRRSRCDVRSGGIGGVRPRGGFRRGGPIGCMTPIRAGGASLVGPGSFALALGAARPLQHLRRGPGERSRAGRTGRGRDE
jgi:hypothetical protein